jgi:hypothetical protein
LHLLGASSTREKREVQHNGLNLFNSPADNRTIVSFVLVEGRENKKAPPTGGAFSTC